MLIVAVILLASICAFGASVPPKEAHLCLLILPDRVRMITSHQFNFSGFIFLGCTMLQ